MRLTTRADIAHDLMMLAETASERELRAIQIAIDALMDYRNEVSGVTVGTVAGQPDSACFETGVCQLSDQGCSDLGQFSQLLRTRIRLEARP